MVARTRFRPDDLDIASARAEGAYLFSGIDDGREWFEAGQSPINKQSQGSSSLATQGFTIVPRWGRSIDFAG